MFVRLSWLSCSIQAQVAFAGNSPREFLGAHCHPLIASPEEPCCRQSPLLGISQRPPSQQVVEMPTHPCSQQLCCGSKVGSAKERYWRWAVGNMV